MKKKKSFCDKYIIFAKKTPYNIHILNKNTLFCKTIKKINWHLFDNQIKLFIIFFLLIPTFTVGQINSPKLSHGCNWVIHHYNTANGFTHIKNVVAEHGGKFNISSELGKGTTVEVILLKPTKRRTHIPSQL